MAFGERQHVLGGVFWHCARHATSTPDCRARSFINALSRDGHCREPRIERKTKDVCHPVIDGGATAYRNLGGAQFHQRVTADAGPGLTPQGVFARRRWPPSWAAAPRRATSFANPREIEVYCCLHPARITDSQRN